LTLHGAGVKEQNVNGPLRAPLWLPPVCVSHREGGGRGVRDLCPSHGLGGVLLRAGASHFVSALRRPWAHSAPFACKPLYSLSVCPHGTRTVVKRRPFAFQKRTRYFQKSSPQPDVSNEMENVFHDREGVCPMDAMPKLAEVGEGIELSNLC